MWETNTRLKNYKTLKVYNKLPKDIRNSQTLKQFKTHILELQNKTECLLYNKR